MTNISLRELYIRKTISEERSFELSHFLKAVTPTVLLPYISLPTTADQYSEWETLYRVSFKKQYNNNHILRYNKESRRSTAMQDTPKHPHDTWVKVTLVARPLIRLAARGTLRIHEKNMCSFSNTASHPNHLLMFLKNLALRILTKKYRITQQYADW
jgi:hypothetical protein